MTAWLPLLADSRLIRGKPGLPDRRGRSSKLNGLCLARFDRAEGLCPGDDRQLDVSRARRVVVVA